MTDFDLSQLFGNLSGTPSGLDALFNEDQRKLMGRNANLAAAAALLQASGRSTTPISIGQALGSALQAGQQGYQQARAGSLQDLLLGEKLKEAQQAAASKAAYSQFLTGQTPTPSAAMISLAAPVETAGPAGPTVQRAELMGQVQPQGQAQGQLSFLTPMQRQLLATMKPEQGIPEILKMSQVKEKWTDPKPFVRNGQTVMLQFDESGNERVAGNMMPYEAQSPDVRAVEYLQGRPLAGTGEAGVSAVGKYRQQIAPKTTVNVPVDMTGGQKGFENEMKLGGAFKQEPIYKDFNEMKSAYSQVISSLDAGTPIGDVAGATKVMKLLDPGSVVRESELGIAMAAGGRIDRLQNYFQNMMSGQKLTPTQRQDFKALSNELYAAAGDAFNKKRKEYEDFGSAYNFKNLGTALGAPASIPSIIRRGAAGQTDGRPSLNNIFGVKQ